jgi:hypothetical protein
VSRARVRVGGAVLALGLAASVVQVSPAWWSRHQFREPLDLAAAALTGPESPNVVQDAHEDDRSWRRAAEVDTTASASAGCDGCTADSSALHIVHLDRPAEATLDNVGVAWSQCVGCRSTALSVQVVVLRSPQTVRANNRALAVNAACESCLTSALAFQIVVVGGRRERLSRAAHDELERWVSEQADALRAAVPAGDPGVAPSGLRTVADEPDATALLDELEDLLRGQLGGMQTIERDAEASTGAPEPVGEPAAEPGPEAAPETV